MVKALISNPVASSLLPQAFSSSSRHSYLDIICVIPLATYDSISPATGGPNADPSRLPRPMNAIVLSSSCATGLMFRAPSPSFGGNSSRSGSEVETSVMEDSRRGRGRGALEGACESIVMVFDPSLRSRIIMLPLAGERKSSRLRHPQLHL